MTATPMTKLGEVLTHEPKSTLKLYEIPDAFEAIESLLLENGGELTEEIEAQLEAIEGDLNWKVERICRLIQNHKASAKAFDEEIDRLKAHKQTHENVEKRLKGYLQSNMERLGRLKIATGIFTVAIQNNSRPSITWTGKPEEIPAGLRRVRIELDGDKAYETLKTEGGLPEGFVVNNGTHLRVR